MEIKSHVGHKQKANAKEAQFGGWLAQSVEPVTLDLRVTDSSPMLGIEFTLKKKRSSSPVIFRLSFSLDIILNSFKYF